MLHCNINSQSGYVAQNFLNPFGEFYDRYDPER